MLELVLKQEQFESCEQILSLCKTKKPLMVIPAYSLAEPRETLIRLEKNRKELQRKLKSEIAQIIRNISYEKRIHELHKITNLLSDSIDEDIQRLTTYRERLIKIAETIPLTHTVLRDSSMYVSLYNRSLQDAFVYASVISHLQEFQPVTGCFLNRNSKDFDDPAIKNELKKYNCIMIPKFDDGLHYIQSQLNIT